MQTNKSSLNKDIEKLLTLIPTAPLERNYWLIRTNGGLHYPSFVKHGFVAIDHEEVSAETYSRLQTQHGAASRKLYDEVKKIVKKHLPKDKEDRSATLGANQITKFMVDLKKGDIVIIPSENSFEVSFGVVMNSAPVVTNERILKITECDLTKRKKVKWVKTINKHTLDPYLYKIFQSHQAINDIGDYKDFIERTLGDFYFLEDELHLVLNVTTLHDINAKALFGLGYNLMELVDEFSNEYSLEINASEISVKTYLNSPGKVDLKSKSAKGLVIAAIIVAVAGGGWASSKTGADFKTDGILKAVNDFLDGRHKRQMKDRVLDKYMDSVKVTTPEDLNKVLEQVSK